MLEHQTVPGVVESLKIITAENTRRLVNFAFNYALENKRKKVTLVHKAVSISNNFIIAKLINALVIFFKTLDHFLSFQNIMKLTDGLFLKVASEVAKDFPSIEFNDMIVDNW